MQTILNVPPLVGMDKRAHCDVGYAECRSPSGPPIGLMTNAGKPAGNRKGRRSPQHAMPAGTVSKARAEELPIILAPRGPEGHPPTLDGLMIEKACNLWLESAQWRCVPTLGATAPSGEAIMEDGIALEAVKRFQSLDADLGRLLASRGNHVHELREGLASFPIKQYQWSGIDLNIIVRSGHELCELVGDDAMISSAKFPALSEAAAF